MSTANETQVGGTHYRTPFQHWDLAHELDLGYFEGQITKYLTRHRFKKGKEDAEKALHFAQKLLQQRTSAAPQVRHDGPHDGVRRSEQAAAVGVRLHHVGHQLDCGARSRDAGRAHQATDP